MEPLDQAHLDQLKEKINVQVLTSEPHREAERTGDTGGW